MKFTQIEHGIEKNAGEVSAVAVKSKDLVFCSRLLLCAVTPSSSCCSHHPEPRDSSALPCVCFLLALLLAC